MEQLFWQNSGNREKARFVRRWEIFSRSKTSASAERRIELPFGSDRILLGSQFGRHSFLAKISNASHKSSAFLVWKEDLAFARTPGQSFALPLQIKIEFARKDKNKIIY
ncbi:hypothetical protein MUO65_02430 [bacterium]|nr:hypothetical protein [bacterium]